MKKGEYTLSPEKSIQCDFCKKIAGYDGRTKVVQWAYMCEFHFHIYGVGLGWGRGQKFITEEELVSIKK